MKYDDCPIVMVDYWDISEESNCAVPENTTPILCKVFGRYITGKDKNIVRVMVEQDGREEEYAAEHTIFTIPKGCVISVKKLIEGEAL